MMNCYRALVWYALILFLAACARPPVLTSQVMVRNATSGTVTEVTVVHRPTNKFGSVNAILPGRALEIGLGGSGVPLLAERGLIQWRDGEGKEHRADLEIPYDPQLAREGTPVSLIYTLHPGGSATATLSSKALGD